MAEDADNDADGQARRRPKVPKPRRESTLIEGKAQETPPERAPSEFPPALGPQEPASPAYPPPTEPEPEPLPRFDPVAASPEPASPGLPSVEPAPDTPSPFPAYAPPEPELEAADPHAAERAAFEPAPEEPPQPPPPYSAPPPSYSAPPPSAPRSAPSGLGYGAIGGLMGAAAALLIGWSLDPRAGALEGVNARLQALEQADASDAQTDKSLAGRIAALEGSRGGAPAPSAPPEAAVKPEALDALDKRLAALEAASPKPEALTAAQNDAREAKDAAARALALASGSAAASAPAPSASPAAEPDPRVAPLLAGQQELTARLARDEASLDERFAGSGAALTDRLNKIDSSLDERLAKGDAALSKAIGDVGARIDKLEAVVFAPKVETRVPPAETAEDAQKKTNAATRAIAALALVERLRSGDPFEAEFAALSRSDTDAPTLEALKPFVASGAPTPASLARAFRDVEPAVLAAGRPPRADGTVGRIMDQMTQLVQVRHVGETPGEAPDAVVTQVEAALSRGDVAGALAAYQKLPDASRAAAADWAKKAQDRVKAEAAAQKLRDASIAGLDATKN